MSGRRKSRSQKRTTCVLCGNQFDSLYRPYKGRCQDCRERLAQERRAKTGKRLLSTAKETTVERDGQTFVVKVLPPKRRSGRW